MVQASGGGSSILAWAPLVFIFLIFYFLLILPQQRKQKQWRAMLGNLKTGDKVTTNGGIKGTVLAVKDDTLVLRCAPDGLKLEFTKSAIAAVTTDEPAATPAADSKS